MRPSYRLVTGALVACLLPIGQALAQDIEPRRWTVMPVGMNVFGAGYGKTNGDIFFDPVLRIEDAEVDADTLGVSYVRAFAVAGRSARFDALLPWQSAHWEGLLDGEPASTSRVGLADPRFRLSLILSGGPALAPTDLKEFMVARPVHTIVGVGIELTISWGEYLEEKLLNLGRNRYTIRPQIGIVHTRGQWSYELTGSTFFFGENDDFFGGSKLEQDPLYAVQAHVIRVFKPGLWTSLSAGYGWGGRSEIDNVKRDDEKANVLAALSFGFPIGSRQGVKIAYLRSETRADTGSDSDSLFIAWSVRY